jgi:hypothetical protein
MLVIGSLAVAVGCGAGTSGGNRGGGGGGGGTGTNVAAVVIDGGNVSGLSYVNGLFTTVTVCVPGTSTCQNIDHVLVDTGSYGLRVLAANSSNPGGLSLSLTTETVGSNSIGECTQFADNSFLWGPVKTADVKIAGEIASSIPINVAGDSSLSHIPTACSGTNVNTADKLGANGILGVGPFPDDCGTACVSGQSPPAPMYYSCTSTTCNPTFVSDTQLVANPVAFFASDNNGVIIQLPAIASTGAPTTNGSMIFGIGTPSNNALPASPQIFSVNNFASFQTTYKGTNFGPRTQSNTTDSYIDSGSNGLFFPDSSIANCPDPNPGSGFFCPTSTQNLSATQVSADGTTSNPVSFSIVSAQTLFNANSGANVAFDDLGGTNSGVFDWGLPFFFGRSVYTGIAGKTTPALKSTPYWAY